MKQALLGYLMDLAAIPSPGGSEKGVRDYIWSAMPESLSGCIGDVAGNRVWQRGGSPYVLLCAHMDTVQMIGDEELIDDGVPLIYDGETLRADDDVQVGFDDKVGLAIILALANCTDLPFRALFTVGEETSQRGARAVDESWFDDSLFALVLDRRGGTDVITSIAGLPIAPPEFVERFMALPLAADRTERNGLASDALVLSEYMPTLNLSVGYYGPHRAGDYCVLSEALATARLVEQAIETRWELTA